LKEALLGFETVIKHLDGSDIVLKRDTITQNGNRVSQPGFVMKLAGFGMPKDVYADDKGDLYATISIVLPPNLSPAQKDAIRINF
jgi:DnaJ-related protein SCJ1